jgi:hypothetical protein
MARINRVNKSRKEQKCSSCGKIIPVGSAYQWISFNYGPTIVKCNSCGFKPYETTSNEYLRSVGELAYNFQESISNSSMIEDLETLRDETLSSLEEIRDDLEDRKSNLPEQFQESGPGEIITERIDNLENVISELEYVDFDFEDVEDVDLSEMIDKVVELESLDDDEVEHIRNSEENNNKEWNEEKIKERYQEWCNELKDEKVEEIKDALNEAINNLEY